LKFDKTIVISKVYSFLSIVNEISENWLPFSESLKLDVDLLNKNPSKAV
jgi:hypothetical protein